MTAEEILKSKLDYKIAILNNPDYTFNKVIEAMQEYADQEARMAFVASRQRVTESYFDGEIKTNRGVNKFKDYDDYKKHK